MLRNTRCEEVVPPSRTRSRPVGARVSSNAPGKEKVSVFGGIGLCGYRSSLGLTGRHGASWGLRIPFAPMGRAAV
ncbi:hypothetical protein EYF80_052487 [Liparis tanakae]|uniref:Uncharacterized protein n=1 Tax=Liparis tanakae TaxID=230148 RepID=A0A4Z2F7Z8_9TELE|nr:hypothetical protein EYF80_052487 [Liparis tanakae]